MFHSNDIVKHTRRGTFGVVKVVDNRGVQVVWCIPGGERISYIHKHTTKVLELAHKWTDYRRFYEGGFEALALYFDHKRRRNIMHNRGQYLDQILESWAEGEHKGLPLDDDDCTCLTRETTVLRNVITTRTLQDMQDMIGPARAALEFNHRATGRSSGVALRWLAACIEEPYTWMKAKDHPVNGKDATMQMNDELFRLAQRIVAVLEWRGFEYNREKGIRFVPIVKEITKYEPTTIIESLR